MSRLLLIGLVAAAILGFWGTDVMAQGDKGFRNPYNRQSGGGAYYYQPVRPSVDGYRTFSYEPIGISPGDEVVVTGEDTKMMRGTDVLGVVPEGLKFRVTKVINGWIGTVVEVDGKKLNGWIRHENVALNSESESAGPPANARSDSGVQTYRRFSYEPSQQNYPSRQQTKPAWKYQKPQNRGIYGG